VPVSCPVSGLWLGLVVQLAVSFVLTLFDAFILDLCSGRDRVLWLTFGRQSWPGYLGLRRRVPFGRCCLRVVLFLRCVLLVRFKSRAFCWLALWPCSFICYNLFFGLYPFAWFVLPLFFLLFVSSCSLSVVGYIWVAVSLLALPGVFFCLAPFVVFFVLVVGAVSVGFLPCSLQRNCSFRFSMNCGILFYVCVFT